MMYPDKNNALFVYNKQGQVNELPIDFIINDDSIAKAQAVPKEDCIIIGLLFQGQIINYIDNNAFFRNISNIERFLIQQSSNTSFVIPTTNYRVAGIPILFDSIPPNFEYVSVVKPIVGYPHVIYTGGYNFEITYKFPSAPSGSWILQFFNGENWIGVVEGSGTDPFLGPVFNYNFSSNYYLRVVDDLGHATKPYYLDVSAYSSGLM